MLTRVTFVAENSSSAPLTAICELVEAVLPHTVRIHTWAFFWERRGRRPVTGENRLLPLSHFVSIQYVDFYLSIATRDSTSRQGSIVVLLSAGCNRSTHCNGGATPNTEGDVS